MTVDCRCLVGGPQVVDTLPAGDVEKGSEAGDGSVMRALHLPFQWEKGAIGYFLVEMRDHVEEIVLARNLLLQLGAK